MKLEGITRPGLARPPRNPHPHSPVLLLDRLTVEVVGPDGRVKARRVKEGNILTTFGLARLASMIGSGGEASNWVSAAAIGTGTTAAASTQSALVNSTAIVHMSQASMDASNVGNMTTRFVMTYASNNPAGAAVINECGLFATNAATASMVARAVLGTASVNKGASDVIQMSHDVAFGTG